MFYWFIKIIAFIPFWLLYPTFVKRKSKLPKGKCIFVCNHLSNIDALLLLNIFTRTQHVLAKKELYKRPLLRAFLKGMKTIPIDRENVEISTVKQCLKLLKNNKTLTIFPEGTRNKTQEPILEIKNGAGIFAVKSSAPIVPIWIKKKPRLFRFNTIYIGEPFYITKEQSDNSGEIIKEQLLKLREESLK